MTHNDSLLGVLDGLRHVSVSVFGDLMLDEYVAGTVERISPEAPVPIVRARTREYRLGGAANVAQQLAALGAHVSLAGVVGNDPAGEQLLRLCEQSNLATSGILTDADRQTTQKLRLLSQGQQLLRVDWEDSKECTPAQVAALCASVHHLANADAVIFSDYTKGVVTRALFEQVLHQVPQGKPVIVDPKQRDFREYRGAHYLTPNLRELSLAVGSALAPDDTAGIVAASQTQARAGGFVAIIVTLGERGMLIVPAHGDALPIAAVRRPVYDVTGAGDTAIAVLAASLATGAPLAQAAHLANVAAGLSVGQLGAAVVGLRALREALLPKLTSKLVALEELAERSRAWRKAGEQVVLTNGCFDLLHAGHLSLLQFARSQGDRLVLAINSDAAVRRLKGLMRPVVSEQDRAALLGALSCVDAVVVFEEDTPLEVIRLVMPHVLVKGQDYRKENVVGREFVEAAGGRVELAPLLPDYSTTRLIARARA